MTTINTNSQQGTLNETEKNIVNMFNKLTPDGKDLVLNSIIQMIEGESNVPKHSTVSEIFTAKKSRACENSFVAALYSSIIEDKRIYKPLIDWGYSDEEMEDIKNRLGIVDEDARFEFEWILADHSAEGEQHGFEQGLKIGMQLAAFAFHNSNE